MFRRRPEARPAQGGRLVEVFVAGKPVQVPEGASAAAAVLLSGAPAIRTTPVGGAPRLPYCMIGICFDCLAEIDGVANRQSCLVPVAPGMRIEPQVGARAARIEDAA
ncbi:MULTISPECIES: (2Fe-2S)-binding protein [unclassified Methylobacterium]|jgi:D-hydroxyproline dehydrogenase subunit gamma|uniref:(2Fe-2S)-binding protein n=1 Tax=unclassified Methylobacterium TaxID=2615210 RepID=UPI00135530CD|nr:(2Fe-2S)-binding protein [Methylobacterium sp. 2A]MWV20543.1 (2Fe-2S)-binding protein [Methylobacterium sp. 2A]